MKFAIIAALCCVLGVSQAIEFRWPHFDAEVVKSESDICTPDQWTGAKIILVPRHEFFNMAETLAYDAKDERIYAKGVVCHAGNVYRYELLRLYKKNKQYLTVEHEGKDGKHQKKCMARSIDHEFKPFCIPEEHEIIATSVLGGKLKVIVYNFTLPLKHMVDPLILSSKTTKINAEEEVLVLTEWTEANIPVAAKLFKLKEHHHGDDDDSEDYEGTLRTWSRNVRRHTHRMANVDLRSMAVVDLYNITSGIKDESVFEPPKKCGEDA